MNEVYSLPIYGMNNELFFIDYIKFDYSLLIISSGLSPNRRYSVEQRSQSPQTQVNSVFLEDFVEMLFGSLNKYVVSLLVRALSEWSYQLANGLFTDKILLPRMVILIIIDLKLILDFKKHFQLISTLPNK